MAVNPRVVLLPQGNSWQSLQTVAVVTTWRRKASTSPQGGDARVLLLPTLLRLTPSLFPKMNQFKIQQS